MHPYSHLIRLRDDLGPDIWARMDAAFFSLKRESTEASWPSWCFCPQAMTIAVIGPRIQSDLEAIYSYRGDPRTADPLIVERYKRAISNANALHVLYSWRIGQGVYRFPRALTEALWATPLAGGIPDVILDALPEWCVYVELGADADLPGRPDGLIGFFARLDWCMDSRDLLLSLDYGDRLEAHSLTLNGGTLEQAIQATLDSLNGPSSRLRYYSQPPEVLGGMLSMLLYLCARNYEIRAGNARADRSGAPSRPEPQKTRKGMRFFPPDQPLLWEAGWRIGPALEAARATESASGDGTHAGPRAHLRRAHWHTYRVGRGRERTELRWLHPILVGAPDDAVPTVREVR